MFRADTVLHFFEFDTYVKLGSFKRLLKHYLLVSPMLFSLYASNKPEMIYASFGLICSRPCRTSYNLLVFSSKNCTKTNYFTYVVLLGSLKKRFQ